ncbi:alpha/beta hydrolase [Breznakia sp. OttesenSCG-928-G09]|nr:alpha/beta hydrolase [Breznakia sp. OttesenSCG-928-G09]
MKKRTKIIIAVTLVFFISFIAIMGFIGNYFYDLALNPDSDKSIVFNNDKTENNTDFDEINTFFENQKYEDRYIENDDLNLHAYDFKQNSDIYVIVVHGYISEANQMGISAEHFFQAGYNVLAVDLRGHGLSDGDYIGMGWDDRKDIQAWIKELVKENSEYKIVLYGVSMGAATVMNTTGENLPSNVKVAIEDCGYTSTWDIFSYQLDSIFSLPDHPFLDSANIITQIRAGYDLKQGAINQLGKSKTPTLFIHGDKDTFVPFYMLDELYKESSVEKEKLVIKGAGHAQSHLVDPERYWKTVDNFIKEYL